jgi:hypothetical protein
VRVEQDGFTTENTERTERGFSYPEALVLSLIPGFNAFCNSRENLYDTKS